MAVLLNHLDPAVLPGGFVGVDVFFVISGYLITKVVVRQISDGTFSFASFYERRVRRLFPALFAVLATSLAVGWWWLLPSDYLALARGTLGVTLFSSNVLFWRELQEGYFAVGAQLNPLLHTWSLAVEEQFYLGFPWLVVIAVRLLRGRVVRVLLAIAALSLVASALMVEAKPVAVFFLTPFRAWELLAGGLLTFSRVSSLEGVRWRREVAAALGAVAVVSSLVFFREGMSFPGLTASIPVVGTAALLHAGAGGPTMVSRVLQIRPLVYLGLISYSLYLWHWPLLVFVRLGAGEAGLEPLALVLLGGASIVLGAASYHLVEQPFRHGFRASRRVVFGVAMACSVGLAVVSVFAIGGAGFPGRVNSEILAFDRARAPQVPFKACDGWSRGPACELGILEEPPEVVLWGDSHALAWAPGVDVAANARRVKVLLLADSACPPILGAEAVLPGSCQSSIAAGLRFIEEHPTVRTVIMSARWSLYFEEGNEFVQGFEGIGEASGALRESISLLLQRGLQVIVVGPVPTYGASVPLALAMNGSLSAASTSAAHHRDRHAFFFDALRPLASDRRLEVLDPMAWLCKDETCRVHEGLESWYRDDNHLSVAGSLTISSHLDAAMGRALARAAQELHVADEAR